MGEQKTPNIYSVYNKDGWSKEDISLLSREFAKYDIRIAQDSREKETIWIGDCFSKAVTPCFFERLFGKKDITFYPYEVKGDDADFELMSLVTYSDEKTAVDNLEGPLTFDPQDDPDR